MKYNDIILLLLILTFILLSIYYIGFVCDFSVTSVMPLADVTGIAGVTGIREAFTGQSYVGDTSCLTTTLVDIIKSCDKCDNMTTTYDALKNNDNIPRNYHTDYTCTKISGSANEYNVDNYPYKYDIRNQHLLLAYKCVKLSPLSLKNILTRQGIETVLSENYKFQKIGTGTGTGLDTANIRGQITNKIKSMITESNKSKGPIYACISQAPYLKGQKARFDIVQHGKGCYDSGKACGDRVLLVFDILLIFTEGNNEKINKFIQVVNNNTSRNALCFLNCGGLDDEDNLGMGCGCLNKNNSYRNADGSSYNSVCLAPDSDYQTNANKNTMNADYSIIYFLNPHNTNGIIIEKWVRPV